MIATVQFVKVIGAPINFGQADDVVFHLNALRWIMDTGDASSLEITKMVQLDQPPTFYPAAWHDVVTLIGKIMGSTDVVFMTNASIWVIMAVVWPLSCMALIRVMFARSAVPVRMAAWVMTVSFAAFPLLILEYGIIYPNIFAVALVPAGVSLLVAGLELMPGTTLLAPTWVTRCLLCFSLVGLSLAQPNALLTVVAIFVVTLPIWAYRGWRITGQSLTTIQTGNGALSQHWRSSWHYPVVLIVGWAVSVIIWIKVRTPAKWGPINTPEASLGEFMLASPMGLHPDWVIGLLLALGLVALVRRADLRWWAGPLLIICLMWVVVSAWPIGPFRTWLVGGYYADNFRLAALIPMALLPMTVAGIEWITSIISGYIGRHFVDSASVIRAITSIVALMLLIVGLQFTKPIPDIVGYAQQAYRLSNESRLVSLDEYKLIKALPDLIPAGAVVATEPGYGSSMAHALAGIHTTTTHFDYISSPDLDIIHNHLDEAASDPELVCPAAERL
ncbi:MAG: hypothetical protein LBV30_04760, partial [Propionibacteriaceae bacterium]|nr:hypothetical protein [Propionibacteriaceae bacterium]